MAIALSIVICAFIVYMLFNNKNMKTYNHYMKRKKQLEESISHFTATESYANQNMAIAINQEEKELCVSTMNNGHPVPLVYNFDDIISCDIIEYGIDDVTTSINNNQRLANVLADSVGKVMDGISGVDEADIISKIDLKISFNDSQNPVVLANFLFWEVSKDSEVYQNTYKLAYLWHDIITNIIKGENADQTLSASI